MKVIIGIPAYNEENNIGPIVAKLKKKYDHILVCDDGSNDMTESIASSLGAIVVKHTTNLGYGAAIKTIFNEARKIDGDVLVTFDADGQHKISEILICFFEDLIRISVDIPIPDSVGDISFNTFFE